MFRLLTYLLLAPFLLGQSMENTGQLQIGSGAFWNYSPNVTVTAKNTITSYNGNQYIAFYASTITVRIAKRNLLTNAVTVYNPGLPANPDSDSHRTISIEFDADGFLHLAYGMHTTELQYYRSTAPEDPSAFDGPLAMIGGAVETSVTYPMFIRNQANGALYFTFRTGGSCSGSQYAYTYTAGSQTWAAMSGTSTAGLLLSDNGGFYLNGRPKFAGSNMWWNWTFCTVGQAVIENEYVAKWDGSGFKTFGGVALTVPITSTNITPAVAITGGTYDLSMQNDFWVSPAGRLVIPWTWPDVNGDYQIYVAESSTFPFTVHKLTSYTDSNITDLSNLPIAISTAAPAIPGPSSVTVGSCDYILAPNNFTAAGNHLAIKSCDNFTTNTLLYVTANYNPNTSVTLDQALFAAQGTVSWLFQNTNDPQYGVTYLTGAEPTAGKVYVLDWNPGQASAALVGAKISGTASIQ